MSVSAAFQKAIYDLLVADAAVGALIGDRVYDRPGPGVVFPYASFGPSDVVTEDFDGIVGRTETVQIDIWSRAQSGRIEAKRIADAVKDALHTAEPALESGALAVMRVTSLRLLDDPDGITTHAVLSVEAELEEAT